MPSAEREEATDVLETIDLSELPEAIDAEAALEDGDLHEYQAIIQQEAVEAINEFRDALIETHGAMAGVYDRNRVERRRTDRSTHSRNPTAVSMLPLSRLDLETDTVYSTSPTRERIYGWRFRRESDKRRQDQGEGGGG